MVDVEEMTTDLVTGESARLFAMMTVRAIVCTSFPCFPDINTFTFISLLPPSHTQIRTHHSQAAQMEFLESHVLQIHVTPKTVMLIEPSVLQTSVDHVMLCG